MANSQMEELPTEAGIAAPLLMLPGSDRSSRLTARQWTHRLLNNPSVQPDGRRYGPAVAVQTFLISLIVTNAFFVIVDTDPDYDTSVTTTFWKIYWGFEFFSVVVFSLEYFGRLWCCVEDQPDQRHARTRLLFGLSPLSLLDLFTILPFIYDLAFERDDRFRGGTLVRLLRVFSLLRVERSVRSFARVFKVLQRKSDELLVALGFALTLLVVSSSLMFYIENPVQPEKFQSMISAMWWAVTALTTVGYGDLYPISGAGKLLGGLVAFIGIGAFALPAGIIASGFVDEEREEHQRDDVEAGLIITLPHSETRRRKVLDQALLQQVLLALENQQPKLAEELVRERLAAMGRDGCS